MDRQTWLLALILGGGLLLRVYDLGTESFWLDEGITIRTITASWTEMKQILSGSVHPPLYYLLLGSWTALFGSSEFAARMPSVIFGLVSIFMAYRVGRLLFDTHVGLFAALFVALSLFQIRYAQEARNYSLLCMLSTMSYVYFIKLLQTESWKPSLSYLTVSTLMLYTHVYGLFTIISHNIYIVIRKFVFGTYRSPSWRHWIGLQIGLALCFLPWVRVLLYHVSSRQEGGGGSGVWQKTPSLFDLAATFAVHAGSQWVLLCCLGMVVVALLLWFKAPEAPWRHEPLATPHAGQPRLAWSPMEPMSLLLVWLGSHTIVPFLLSQVVKPIYIPRYTIAGAIAFYVLIAVAMRRLQYRKMLMTVTLAGFCILCLFNLWGYCAQYNKERWREVAAYIRVVPQ